MSDHLPVSELKSMARRLVSNETTFPSTLKFSSVSSSVKRISCVALRTALKLWRAGR